MVKYLQDWIDSAGDAEAALQNFRDFLLYAKGHLGWVPRQAFYNMLREMRNEGLEGWLDSHPLDCDRLYEAVTGEAP